MRLRIYKALSFAMVAGSLLARVAFGSACTGPFLATGSEQQCTVAQTGVYQVLAYGAQGGGELLADSGGLGAEVGGDISFNAGQLLDLYIGKAGASNYDTGGGGGGATFVLLDGSWQLLAVAGGGGGGAELTGANGSNASLSEAGLTGTGPGGAGGSGGSGGQTNINVSSGGGGGGYLSNGQDAESNASGGHGFGQGLAGGGGWNAGGYGGGGGGGSYLESASFSQLVESVGNSGDGEVLFTLESQPAASAPEPGSFLLMGVAAVLTAAGVIRKARS